MNNFTSATAAYYLRCFHRSESLEIVKQIETSKQINVQAKRMLRGISQLRTKANEKRATNQTAEADSLDIAASEQESEAKKMQKEGEARLKVAQDEALKQVERFYYTQFGRRRFILPLSLLVMFSGVGLYLIAASIIQWHSSGQTEGGMLPLSAVLALAGGYTWVFSDLITRGAREEISPGDLFWSSFRLVIAIPIGYAFGMVFSSTLSLPMSYLLGSLPTGTIMTVAGRAAAKWLQLTDAGTAQSSLQKLATIDTYLAERFAAEGITTVEELAYADPIRLSIRTGLNFSVILCCTGEALLGSYWRESEHLSIARKYGLSGSYECAQLWEESMSEIDEDKSNALKIITSLSSELHMDLVGVKNVLSEVANDPYTLFQRESWAVTMD